MHLSQRRDLRLAGTSAGAKVSLSTRPSYLNVSHRKKRASTYLWTVQFACFCIPWYKKSMKKDINVRIDRASYQILKKVAEAEGRTLKWQFRAVMAKYVELS